MYYLRKKITRGTKRALGLATFPPPRYRHLYDEVERVRPTRVLEVGTNDGINAVELARVARRVGVQIEYYGFDLFESLAQADLEREFSIRTRSLKEVETYLRRNGVENPKLFAGDTRATLREAARVLPPMDLIFIDGGHSYETVASDWNNVKALVTPTTSVLFDDYPNFGIGRAVDEIDRTQWDVSVFPTVDRFAIKDPAFAQGGSATTMGVQIARVTRRT